MNEVVEVEDLRRLKFSNEWSFLKKFINERRQVLIDKLLNCGIDELYSIRGEIKAYDNIVKFIESGGENA